MPASHEAHAAAAHQEAHDEAHARSGGARVIARVGEVAVVALTGSAFAALPREQRLLAYWLAQAARAGDAVAWDQSYRHNLPVVRLVRGVLSRPDATPEALLAKVRDYARALYLNRGLHEAVSERKLLPPFSAAELRLAALAASAAGANLGFVSANPAAALGALEGPLFDPGLDALRTARPAGEDALLASAVNLYAGVSLKEAAGFREEHAGNARLAKLDGRVGEEIYRVGAPGLYATDLVRAVAALNEAAVHAQGAQRQRLERVAAYLRFGSPDELAFADAADAGDVPEVDTALGFLATGADPRGVKGLWLGLVGARDPEGTARVARLSAAFAELEQSAPWPDEYKRRGAKGPTAEALSLLSAAGAARPDPYTGLRSAGKALIFAEVDDALATARELHATSELAPRASAAALLRCRAQVERAKVELREVIGRFSGTPPPADQARTLSVHGPILEEARAELVAHFHAADPRLLSLGVLEDKSCQPLWAQLAGISWVSSLARMQEGEHLETAELRATQLMLWWFLQRGAISLTREAGKTVVAPADGKKFHAAAASLLTLLQTIRSTGDVALFSSMVEAHAARLDPALRDEVAQRFSALGIPRRVAVLSPVLRPVITNGKVTDAEAAPVENLDGAIEEDWMSF